jgi:hypothetical protein
MAMENGPFKVDVPIKHGVVHCYVGLPERIIQNIQG